MVVIFMKASIVNLVRESGNMALGSVISTKVKDMILQMLPFHNAKCCYRTTIPEYDPLSFDVNMLLANFWQRIIFLVEINLVIVTDK